MTHLIQFLFSLIVSSARARLSLQFEVAALRHQLSVYRVERRKPRISSSDRMLWSLVSKWWSGLAQSVVLCSASDRGSVAESVISGLLACVEPAWTTRPAKDRPGAATAHQADVAGQPYVGLTPDRLGTQNAGHRCRKIHRRAVQTQAPQTALPDPNRTSGISESHFVHVSSASGAYLDSFGSLPRADLEPSTLTV